MKKTLVLGASEKPDRYSNKAAKSLLNKHHPVVLLGNKSGTIEGHPILTGRPELSDIDTVTLYLNPFNQKDWYSYILNLNPRRLIFNPGTENPELEALAREKGINCQQACTLVLLSIGAY